MNHLRIIQIGIFLLAVLGANALLAWSGKFNLLVPLLAGGLLSGVVWLFSLLGKWKKETQLKSWSVLVGIILAMLIGETFLRIQGSFFTYAERNYGYYINPYKGASTKDWYHLWRPNTDITIRHVEFVYPKRSNALGLSEREIPKEKPENVFRIFGVGDSFTEGVGAPADSVWTASLSAFAENRTQPVEVYNAGVSGSDVFYGLTLIRDKLINYQPDLFLLLVNESDLQDIMIRGGMERFLPDGTVRYGQPPWFEPVYRHCHLLRVWVHQVLKKDEFFLTENQFQMEQQRSLDCIGQAFAECQELCAENGVDFVAVFQPVPDNIRYRTNPFESLIHEMKGSSVSTLDLFDYFFHHQPIPETEFPKLYWPMDRHFNGKGYFLLGEAIGNDLDRMNMLPQMNKNDNAATTHESVQ